MENMLPRIALSLLMLQCCITQCASRSTTARNKRPTTAKESTQFPYLLEEVLEDASWVFGKVLERMVSHKKILGVETGILW